MKMEYLGDKSILILSTPWEQDGKEYVLELGRDVTNSFSVYMLPAKTAVSCGN